MLLCLGDRGVGAAVRAEAMTAGMKRRFEDRLQDLENRLLNHPIHHVRNAKRIVVSTDAPREPKVTEAPGVHRSR